MFASVHNTPNAPAINADPASLSAPFPLPDPAEPVDEPVPLVCVPLDPPALPALPLLLVAVAASPSATWTGTRVTGNVAIFVVGA